MHFERSPQRNQGAAVLTHTVNKYRLTDLIPTSQVSKIRHFIPTHPLEALDNLLIPLFIVMSVLF